FFFSSRRRHTRSKRDWSSDVCSSDLHVRLLVALVVLGVALSLVSVSVTALTVDVLFLKEERSSTTWCSTRDGVRGYGDYPQHNEIGRASCREGGERRVGGGAGKEEES